MYQNGVVNADFSGLKWSQNLIGNPSKTMILNIQNYSDSIAAQSDLAQGIIQAVIIIPENFGVSCNSFWDSPTNSTHWINTTITLFLDSGSLFATQAIPTIVQQTFSTAIYRIQSASTSGPVTIGSPSLINVSKITTFDYFAQGFFAFFFFSSLLNAPLFD